MRHDDDTRERQRRGDYRYSGENLKHHDIKKMRKEKYGKGGKIKAEYAMPSGVKTPEDIDEILEELNF